MDYEARKKIYYFIAGLIPWEKRRKRFLKRMLCTYDWHRLAYKIGEHSYMGETSKIQHPDTTVGKFCSIAHEVLIGTSQHPTNYLTTHSFAYCQEWPKLYGNIKTPKEYIKDVSSLNGPCKIGNDVWIGRRVIIKDGVTIGDGAVVGAGAIVTKDVPPYSVCVGVPAKVVKYRFDQDTIQKLLELKWWDMPHEVITKLPFDDVKKCVEVLQEYKNKTAAA